MSVKSWATEIDSRTLEQAERASRIPVIAGHLALMPDAHWGIGATVGSVIPTEHAIIPSAVGVDIGCGMIAVQTDITASRLPDNLNDLHQHITRSIPSGVGTRHGKATDAGLQWLADHPTPVVREKWKGDASTQLGTLGSGNHFLEVCLDENNMVWVVLHSGSRGVGNKLATWHIDRARGLEANLEQRLEDPDLMWFMEGTPEFQAYISDMLWAQNYAKENREIMMDLALKDLFSYGAEGHEIQRINCHHNYAVKEVHFGREVWITRKGAIRASVGDLGIIPGSMATGSYIVEGLGNPESYNSSSHGAGRRLSRGQARRTLTEDSLVARMTGKAWNSGDAIKLLDEHPDAYKPIESVMEAQKDLTRVVHTLRQVLNYKGADKVHKRR